MRRAFLYARVSNFDQNPQTQLLDYDGLRSSAASKSFANTPTRSAAQKRSARRSTRCWLRPTDANATSCWCGRQIAWLVACGTFLRYSTH